MYRQKGDFIRLVCVRIAATVDKINKMAHYKVNKNHMTQNKPIYHARSVNRWEGLGKTFYLSSRFTNPQRDKSFYFCHGVLTGYLLFILPDYKINQFRKIPDRMLQNHVTKETFVGISNETVRPS